MTKGVRAPSSFAVCLLIVLFHAGIGLASDEKTFERTFKGTINESWKIEMTLRTTNPISGTYFYERTKKPIPIKFDLRDDQKWLVTEFDGQGNITGQFLGDILGRVFYGTWTNSDGSKTFPFHLTETSRKRGEDETPYRSTKKLVEQARKGNPDAQFHLAFLYHYGQGGLTHNIREAIALYEKAASQGHAKSQYTLGTFYLSGHYVKPNVETGLELFRKAASAGDRLAKKQLEEIEKYKTKPYLEKRQNTKDVQYYVDLMETDPADAERGLKSFDTPDAKVYLAYLYYEGMVKVPDPVETVNSLLRETGAAIKMDLGEVNETIYGVGHTTILEYIREAAGHITVPCDVFVAYPKSAFEAFGSHYGGCRDAFPKLCGSAVLQETVPTIDQYLSERGKGINKECDVGTIRCAIGKGQWDEETVWNVAPQTFLDRDIETYECGVCDGTESKIERLRKKALIGLKEFFFQNFYFTRDSATKLAHGYLKFRDKFEDAWDELYSQCSAQ